MKIYQTCGKITIDAATNTKTISPKIMLPNLKHGGRYECTEFYNISNSQFYGVLVVLNVDGEMDIDLREYKTDRIELTQTTPFPLNLHDVKNPLNARDFSNLSTGDKITLICYHDNTFTRTNVDMDVLSDYRHRINDLETGLETNKSLPFQPKIGNGGILTVYGCTF